VRIVVTGATGNVGTSVVRALGADARVTEIVGVARRVPRWSPPRTRWVAADVGRSALEPLFAGADAVVHLAWRIQPSHALHELHETNVTGSRRVFEAAAAAGVPALVAASSVGVYSPGPKDRPVGEDWPRDGVPGSFYARHKAAMERELDRVALGAPAMRVVRLRPALIFKRGSASGVRRLFAGPLLPGTAVRPLLRMVVPSVPGLRVQAVHADDVADAYVRAALDEVEGPFNIAADPVLDARAVADALGGRTVPLPAGVVRAAAGLTWRLRLQPTPPGWLDMALGTPLLDTGRARRDLGWAPRMTALEALADLLDGLAAGAGEPTPPLEHASGGPLRAREVASGVGGADGARGGRAG
jgi:nucleoside-diphosphate-sugar epimerase